VSRESGERPAREWPGWTSSEAWNAQREAGLGSFAATTLRQGWLVDVSDLISVWRDASQQLSMGCQARDALDISPLILF
jgi:hypothetical protein